MPMPPHGNRPGNLRQPVSMTLRTGRRGHALLQFLSGRVRLGLPVPAGNIVQDSLKGLLQHPHAIAPVVGHPKLLPFGAVENYVHGIPGKFFHRHRQGEMVFLCQRLKIHPENGIRPGALPSGSLNRPVKNRLVLVRDHQILVSDQLKSQAGAAGTSAAGIVERKHPRFQFRQADAAVITGIILGKTQFFLGCGKGNGHQAAGMVAGRFNGVGQTAAKTFFQHQGRSTTSSMVCFLFFSQLISSVRSYRIPSTRTREKPAFRASSKTFLCSPFFPSDNRRKHQKFGSLPQIFHPVHNLVNGLPADLLGRIWDSEVCPPVPTADAGSRRSPSPFPPWNVDSWRWSSDRWKWPVKGRQWNPRPACPSGPKTARA